MREGDGTTAVDLTGAASVTFRMREGGIGTSIGGACIIVEIAAGRVQYPWGATDLDVVGDYLGEFEVTWLSGRPETFPARSPFTIEVREELD